MFTSNGSALRLVALRHRDFRLFWIGQLFSGTGAQMQLVAVDWHVYQLLRGTFYTFSLFGREIGLDAKALGLGTLGLVRILPVILFALFGGLVADAHDRRRVMILTRSVATIFAVCLAAITLVGHANVAMIYLLTAAGAATTAFDNPARQSLVPNLVPREHLTNAISLNTLLWQITTIVGSALAGVLVGSFSVGLVYAVSAVWLSVIIITLLLMQSRGRAAGQSAGLGWSAMVEGMRFTYRSRIIWGTMLLDFFATFFSSARTMLPIVANDILKVGVGGYGLLNAAQPVGALIAGAILSLRKDIHRQGIVLIVCVALYGLATALFGASTLFVLAFVLLALTGAADTISTVIRSTLRQLLTPDHLRGRMTSVNMIFFMGGPQLGELEAGLVAALWGAPFSILSGGIATVLLTAWVAWKYPQLRRYTSDMQGAA
jgi:MFS family permease